MEDLAGEGEAVVVQAGELAQESRDEVSDGVVVLGAHHANLVVGFGGDGDGDVAGHGRT